jgi:hypothetical protein
MRTALLLLILIAAASFAPLRAAADEAPATQPTAQLFDPIAKSLGMSGALKDDVYTMSLARKDLQVFYEDGVLPAGVMKTEFQFFKCECGKMFVMGQFCVAEYESNDVIDALRGGQIKVAGIAPVFEREHPRMLMVRFHGGGTTENLVKTLKDALGWTGEARMAPATKPAAAAK